MTAIPQTTAKELTQDEAQARAEHCFELEQSIKDGLKAGREAMWDVAAALHEFDEENGWSALGHESLTEWLADPEVTMTRTTYYRMVSAYRQTVVQRQVPVADVKELDYSKVDIVIGAVKAGRVKIQDALDDAKQMGARDLRNRYMKRPDPADKLDGDDNSQVTQQAVQSEPKPALAPDDEPVLASDVEPAQNDNGSTSGQVPEDDPMFVDNGGEVIDGTARDVNHHSRADDGLVIPPGRVRGIKKLSQEGKDALALPDRQAPDRRAKREALENLIIGLESVGLA
jgi:hypothetical protein